MSTALALARRWVVDYFNRHDAATAREFCAPDYTLHIGDAVFSGRDASWLPAVDEQMRAFPGLGMTVHQTLCGDNWAAVWFSQHGASRGRVAVWSGVAIYRREGDWLSGCTAQEDYYTRRRQLKSGVADRVDPPCAAPWDVAPATPDHDAEDVVADWLRGNWPVSCHEVVCDDDHLTGKPLRFLVQETLSMTLLSSGPHVAFYTRQRGIYHGGLAMPCAEGRENFLDCNGIVTVSDGVVSAGRVIRDRMGLWARLKGVAA